MKKDIIFFTVIIAIINGTFCHPSEGTRIYSTKYDNIDVDGILKSERLVTSYFNCIMTGNGCTPEGKELRGNMEDVVKSSCSKCSEKQKELGEKILRFLIEKRPDLYRAVEAKYDPEGEFKKKHAADLAAKGLKLLKK